MRHGKGLNKTKVLICLLAYFLGWIESANALPLLFVVSDDSHKAIITENQGKFHLTVHHRGNGDKHEHAQRNTAIITSSACEQSDHELGVSGGDQLISPATKIIKAVNDIFPLPNIPISLVKAPSHNAIYPALLQANFFSPVHTTVLLV